MRSTTYRFGQFELDPASRELLRGGERIALPPKSFECLAYLLSNRERAVGRDELISAVWGRVEVSDTVVAQTLLRARKAIGDSGSRQHSIRTVPRFGYRWVAPLCETPPGAVTPQMRVTDAQATSDDGAKAGPCHGWWSLLVLAGVAALTGWLFPYRTLSDVHDRPRLRDATMAAPSGDGVGAPAAAAMNQAIHACRAGPRERATDPYECAPADCDSPSLRLLAGGPGECGTGDDDPSVRKRAGG